jgi:hypothetical protein
MEYPYIIWPYMVQYLQFRILEFPWVPLGPLDFLGWPNFRSHIDPHCILLKQWLENKVIPYHISLTSTNESVPKDES